MDVFKGVENFIRAGQELLEMESDEIMFCGIRPTKLMHIYVGIERLAELAGEELKDGANELFFHYNNIKYFQLK